MRKKQYKDFLDGKLNHQQAEEFIEWLNSREGELEAKGLIEQDWTREDATDSMNDVRLHGMLMDLQENVGHKPSQKPSYMLRSVLRIAAVILIGLGVSFFILTQNYEPLPEARVSLVTKSNPEGQKTTVFLPDGTKVFLNAASTLSYPKQFNNNTRTVQLTGEAFFDVAHDETKPFIVTSDRFSTTALGTSFNVRAYQTEDLLSVALATGKVLVQDLNSGNQDGMFLVPGERMSFSKKEKEMQKSLYDDKAAFGWKEGLIYFDEASLNKVVEKLSRWYGVKIRIKGKPGENWTYKGEFKNQSLDHVLMGMGLTKSFEYTIENKNVILDFNN